MRQFISIVFAVFLCLSMLIIPVFGYGYKKEEDPLIKGFKAVVFYGKEENWNQIKYESETLNDRVKDVNIIFGVDLLPQLNESIEKKDFQSLIKNMANLIFLAIREKFYWNTTEQLKIYIKAKVRLRLAEEYYVTLLAGNVREFDLRNGTSINDEIFQKFAETHKTLGSLGFFGVGAAEPDLGRFVSITNEIEEKIKTVFLYFK